MKRHESKKSTPKKDCCKPKAIAAVQVGEHNIDAAKSLSAWLTECLQNKMKPSYFSKIWERHIEGQDEEDGVKTSNEVPGKTSDGEFWEDHLGNIHDIDVLYRKAVRNKADTFITFDDNSFVSIVALRLDPGAYEIEKCIIKSKDVGVVVSAGSGSAMWPEELGSGVPIKSLYIGIEPICIATLRNDTEIVVSRYSPDSENTVYAEVCVGGKMLRRYEFKYKVDSKKK